MTTATSGVLAGFPRLLPIRNPCELRGLCRHSYFGPRTFGGGLLVCLCGNRGTFKFSYIKNFRARTTGEIDLTDLTDRSGQVLDLT